MPIDPSIALGVKPIQLTSPQELYAAEQTIKANRLQDLLGQAKLQDMEYQTGRRNKLMELYSQYGDNPDQLEPALLKSGFADEASKRGKDRRENMKTDVETEKTQLANLREKTGFVASLLGGVKDQASYDQMKLDAKAYGLPVDNLPPAFSPQLVQQKLTQALTAQQQVDQQWKAKGFDLDVQKFGEQQRHNRTTEGLTARGQNMTDARARDLNQITKDNKPLTDAQSKAALFGSRMQSANEVLSSLAADGTTTSVPGSRAGFGIGSVVNALSPAKQQQLDQAKRDFVNAVLRRESGAVIADSEFDNADKQYFPQVGDSKEVIAQKARNREIAIRGVQAEVPQSQRSSVIGEITGTPKVPTGNRQGGGAKPSVSNW